MARAPISRAIGARPASSRCTRRPPPRRGPDRPGIPIPRTVSTRRTAPVEPLRSARLPTRPTHLGDAAHAARPYRSDPIARSRHRQAEIALCHRRWLCARGNQRFFMFSEIPGRGRPAGPVPRARRSDPADPSSRPVGPVRSGAEANGEATSRRAYVAMSADPARSRSGRS